jgi:hypothetical protein
MSFVFGCIQETTGGAEHTNSEMYKQHSGLQKKYTGHKMCLIFLYNYSSEHFSDIYLITYARE